MYKTDHFTCHHGCCYLKCGHDSQSSATLPEGRLDIFGWSRKIHTTIYRSLAEDHCKAFANGREDRFVPAGDSPCALIVLGGR